MATNEILPFASTNTGTNLLTQAEYTSDAQRTIGHQPGIARSKLENKVLRQASLLAAGLAEFIADYQANNVTDSLTAQQVADYLLAAIQAVSPSPPDASTTVKGLIEIATAAEAQAYSSSLLALTPSTLNQALKGANQSLANPGFQKLPGGLILQFGNDNVVGSKTITFPIAFPTVCIGVQMSVGIRADPSINYEIPQLDDITTTNFFANPRLIGGGTYSGPVWWFAVGY